MNLLSNAPLWVGKLVLMADEDTDEICIMVSSTVYGRKPLLKQIYAILTGYGYRVMMSDMGTVRHVPGKTPFESCLQAVEDCDFFFSIIFPYYGSGIDPDDPNSLSITHQEILKAIELNKPRIYLADDKVVNARKLLKDLGINDKAVRLEKEIILKKGATVISDLRVIDMYEAAIRNGLPLGQRTDSWVQEYQDEDAIKRFVDAQFSDKISFKRNLDNHYLNEGNPDDQ